MDSLDWVLAAERPLKRVCRVSKDLDSVTHVGDEAPAVELGATPGGPERVWDAVRALYRTSLYPAIQLCVRRRGEVVLQRAIGHASGTGPDDPEEVRPRRVSVETPFLLYSASKAITAMLIHKLDEQHKIHLDDRVCEYIPEFAQHGKEWITVRHVLAHRAGIPAVPPGVLDLDLLDRPQEVVGLLCELEPLHMAGRRLAYHAVSGGFVLGEIARRVTGTDVRGLMRKEVAEPLGFRWMNFGVRPEDVDLVARDARTGLPVLPPFSWLLRRALGVEFRDVVAVANDPRFLTAVVPSANLVATADELSAFYQCLLDGGERGGVRIFEPRTIGHATSEQTFLELDLTLGLPLRYGLGLMLGDRPVGLFGLDTPNAFGHLGFTNIFSWADPDRQLSVALLSSGKPFLSLDSIRLLNVLLQIGRAFPVC